MIQLPCLVLDDLLVQGDATGNLVRRADAEDLNRELNEVKEVDVVKHSQINYKDHNHANL